MRSLFLLGYSHLSHGFRQVGGDGSEAPPSTVNDVVAAGTHRRTGAGRQAARLNEGTAAVAYRQTRKTVPTSTPSSTLGSECDVSLVCCT